MKEHVHILSQEIEKSYLVDVGNMSPHRVEIYLHWDSKLNITHFNIMFHAMLQHKQNSKADHPLHNI